MNQHAEYVSPGHPDRLADAIAESIVTAAVRQKPDALVGVEVAVHTDCVFADGRIAAGAQPIDVEKIVRTVYRAAAYGGSWNPDPRKIRVTTDLCQEVLSPEEADIRPFSDDQNIVIGYACGDERTNYLPVAHWVSGELGRRLFAALRSDPDSFAIFGPDFKILASLEAAPGETRVEWRRLVLSIQHISKLPYERQHRILLPLLEQILKNLEKGGLKGAASTFTWDKLVLNGAGEFAIGGPEGDNGLSGKKLVIDHYGPGVPIGGGALSGKDPHKVDKCGALRARQLAKKLVREGVDEARVLLGWAPGNDSPFVIEASTTQGGVTLRLPREELPSQEWFAIKSIVRDLELHERDWAADLLAGYFCQHSAPWER
jgi:S-adenosylmethionine synthetase